MVIFTDMVDFVLKTGGVSDAMRRLVVAPLAAETARDLARGAGPHLWLDVPGWHPSLAAALGVDTYGADWPDNGRYTARSGDVVVIVRNGDPITYNRLTVSSFPLEVTSSR